MPGAPADAVRLADERAALRRLAELVARGPEPAAVFGAIAAEACGLLQVTYTVLLRLGDDESATIIALHNAPPELSVGDRWPPAGGGLGGDAAAASTILMNGQPWGMIVAPATSQEAARALEERLADFAELTATAIAAAQTMADLRGLADEQAALRRVAELVAAGASSQQIFDTVATEASSLLGGQAMTLTRFAGDRELIVVATSGGPAPIGTRVEFEAETLPDWVRREGRVVRIDDYANERDSSLADSYELAAAVAAPISVDAEVWGMLTATSSGRSLPADTERRLLQFAERVAAALSNSQARDDLQSLADEQSALRRIAELTAQEAPTEAVLEAVAVQASRLAGVEFGMVLRFEPDGSTEIVALAGAPENFKVGLRAPNTGDSAVRRVWLTGRAARIDDLASMSGQWPRMAVEFGFSTSAGVPVLLQGRLWGAVIVVGRDKPMLPAIETHLTDFAELVSTAISAAQARAELRVLADEQAALRRVAELVAQGAPLDEVFAAVATEASNLLGDLEAVLVRYTSGDTAVAGAAVPITVEGRVWGALTTSAPESPLPSGSEERLAQFAELAAVAIANAEHRENLTASRARVIATADETRRRLQRDLHDGSQQRLVHALITLQLAKDAAAKGESAAALIDEALGHAQRANSELRDLVRGILPASLTRGGLRAGIESLVSDIPMRVNVAVTVPRLPAPIETTAYFIAAEALTNVVKHAHASHATVEVGLQDDELSITVRDDGAGGADPADGTGLTGLRDRVEANAGTLVITSPPELGTTLHVTLPLSGAR